MSEIKVLTAPDLNRHILELWEEKKKESLILQEESEKELRAAIEKESDLQAPLKEARKIIKQMEEDYKKLEQKSEQKIRERVEKSSLREKDVLSGKVTLREFNSKGISEKKITEKIFSESIAELEGSLSTVRKKNIEILRLEQQLYKVQTLIRNLILRPAKILRQVFKDCCEIADIEIGSFLSELQSANTALALTDHKILLTQGKSLSPGYRWDHLTYEQALSVQFDPILDMSCVQELKTQLKDFKDFENISVVFYLKSKSVEVSASGKMSRRKER